MKNIIGEIEMIGALEQASETVPQWHDPYLCKIRRGDAPCEHPNCNRTVDIMLTVPAPPSVVITRSNITDDDMATAIFIDGEWK